MASTRAEVLGEVRMMAVRLVTETEETDVAEALRDGVVSLQDVTRAFRKAVVDEVGLDEERVEDEEDA